MCEGQKANAPLLTALLLSSLHYLLTCLLALALILERGHQGFFEEGLRVVRLPSLRLGRLSLVSSLLLTSSPPPASSPTPPPFSLSLLCLTPSLPTACGEINDIWSYTAALVQYMSHHQMYVALSS